MKVLVTGHLGYIGNKAYHRLLGLGHEVVGIDVKDGKDVRTHLPDETFDYVLHFAASPSVQFSVDNPSETLNNNVYSTSVLLEWAKNHGVKRLVFSSSAATLGTGNGIPTSPYGLQKLLSEKECALYSRLYGLDTVCLRYFNVFSSDQPFGGAYSTAICAWKHMLEAGKPLRLDGSGDQTRDFIHVDDIVNANLHFMLHDEDLSGSVIEIGTGSSISLLQIKEIIDSIYPNTSWEFADTRVGDIKHSVANTEKSWNLKWLPKVNPMEAIKELFENIDV